MTKKIISTDQAPQAIGPYSQGVKAGDFLFCSGQLPIDPKTGELSTADVFVQTQLVLENLKAVLEAAGSSLQQVVKCTVFLKDMNDFQNMNKAYTQFFVDNPPARAAVEVARLPKDVSVEIEAIAYCPSS